MITTLYAGLLAIIYIGLALFTVKGRFKHRISLGDGGNDNMNKRIRIHGNFNEYIPFALLLMLLLDIEETSEIIIHALGVSLIIGRLLHFFGIYHDKGPSFGRTGGMIITLLVVLVAAVLCIKAYFTF